MPIVQQNLNFRSWFIHSALVAQLFAFGYQAPVWADINRQNDERSLCAELLHLEAMSPARAKKEIFYAFKNFKMTGTLVDKKISLESLAPTSDEEELGTETEKATAIVVIPEDTQLSNVLNKTTWSLGSDKYEFIDVGYLHMENQSKIASHIVLHHIMNYPNQNLEVEMSPSTVLAADVIRTLRWATHDSVLQKYQETKTSLRPNDLAILRNVSQYSANSEVLGLIDYSKSQELKNVGPEELEARLQMTIQITYFSNRDFLTLNLRSLYLAMGLKLSDDGDQLPFEYRLEENKARNFRKRFYKRFHAQTTCEFTRYAKFRSLPDPVQSRLLLEALNRAIQRGMKTIVASTDEATSRLFKRYGFKTYETLPIEDSSGVEYLMYLEVDSEEFKEVYSRLEDSGQSVEIETEVIK